MLALGSRGDVQPYIALGLGLQAAGHEVCVATNVNYKSLVVSRGLSFFPIVGNPMTMLDGEVGGGLLNTGRDLIQFMRSFRQVIGPLVEQILDDLWRACQEADVIFYSLLGFASHYIAQELRIPAIAALLQPLSRTCYFPTILAPPQTSLGGGINFLTHILVEQFFWQPLRPFFNKWSKKRNGPKAPFWGHFGQLYQQKAPFLYGYSPTVVPRPRDWGEGIHVTGYWFLDSGAQWVPPAELVDFLASGPPPLCVGFGSMKSSVLEERTEIVLSALARSRQRGILLTGWGGFSNSDLPDSVFKIEAVPHDWLFPHVSAVIHHGGAGTTAAAMRAGIPSIILPFFFDQSFWAQRIAALGVGPPPIAQKRLSVETLTAAIQSVTNNQTMRQRAVALGQRIRAEDGVAEAVNAFHQHLPD